MMDQCYSEESGFELIRLTKSPSDYLILGLGLIQMSSLLSKWAGRKRQKGSIKLSGKKPENLILCIAKSSRAIVTLFQGSLEVPALLNAFDCVLISKVECIVTSAWT